MEPQIQRVDTYDDARFSQRVLAQHGAFLVDGVPYEVEILDGERAVVRGKESGIFPAVIERFRFFSGHISQFLDENGQVVRVFPGEKRFFVKLNDLQPSQFYVDEEKIQAVKSFVAAPEDVVIPVTEWNGRYISQDGHTRLAVAVEMGFDKVYAFIPEREEESRDWLFRFAQEARRRNVYQPCDLIKVSHDEYEVLWNQFCDSFLSME